MAEKISDTPVPVYDQQPQPIHYQPTPIQPQQTPMSPQPTYPQQHQGPIQPDIAYLHDPIHGQQQTKDQSHQMTFYGGMQHPSGYNTASPLHALQRGPAPVDCPVCGYREMTRVEAEAGSTTHGWAAVLCCCFCLGCIPYLMTSLKDMHHHCGKCGALLATWHNSGRVEVHQNVRSG